MLKNKCFLLKLFLFFYFGIISFCYSETITDAFPLENAYTHNDQEQAQPFYTAIDNGFTWLEPDAQIVSSSKKIAEDSKGENYIDVAMSPDNKKVIQIHRSETSEVLWYRLGNVVNGEINWQSSHDIGGDIGSKFVNISISQDNDRYKIIEIHQHQDGDNYFYHVGYTNGDGTISWYGSYELKDNNGNAIKGSDFIDVALNKNGTRAVVTYKNNDNYYQYLVGNAEGNDFVWQKNTITYKTPNGEYAPETGDNFITCAVSPNMDGNGNSTVIQVHCYDNKLYYQFGVLNYNELKINWKDNSYQVDSSFIGGEQNNLKIKPYCSVALSSDNAVIAFRDADSYTYWFQHGNIKLTESDGKIDLKNLPCCLGDQGDEFISIAMGENNSEIIQVHKSQNNEYYFYFYSKDMFKDQAEIMVGHDIGDYEGKFYDLYVEPLADNNCTEYIFSSSNIVVHYNIDMKTNFPGSIEYMNNYFENYSQYFNNYSSGENHPVSVSLSGYNDFSDLKYYDLNYLMNVSARYIGIDGRTGDDWDKIYSNSEYTKLFPIVSCDNINVQDIQEKGFNVVKKIDESSPFKCKFRTWGKTLDELKNIYEEYSSETEHFLMGTDDVIALKEYLLNHFIKKGNI